MGKRIVIAGVNSGSGKTTITSGLMRLLTQKGIKVQPFKSGPDFIDPTYHTKATGNFSRNLDSWMFGEDLLKELLDKNSKDADISIIEGVMGLFDGKSGTDERGSSSHLAKITKSPVILVLDSRSIARSAAAIVYGFMHYDPDLMVKGVILNKVASQRHLQILKDAIEPLGIQVVGYLMRNDQMKMPERKLGLIPASEMALLDQQLDYIASEMEKTVDYKKILEIADQAEEFSLPEKRVFSQDTKDSFKDQGLKIGLALDAAFSFYYHDGIDYLKHLGAEIIPFSPLKDKKLPEGLSGLILGGGFPELHLEALKGNKSFIKDLREKVINKELALMAESGGLLYLANIASLVPGKVELTDRLAAMGYRRALIKEDSVLGKKDQIIIGHEFHYSLYEPDSEDLAPAFTFEENSKDDGYSKANIVASYLHFHLAANPQIAENFLQNCLFYKKRGRESL